MSFVEGANIAAAIAGARRTCPSAASLKHRGEGGHFILVSGFASNMCLPTRLIVFRYITIALSTTSQVLQVQFQLMYKSLHCRGPIKPDKAL
jgi:hypothetical protein